MMFRTRIWHPNVHWTSGEICLDVLAGQWSPAWTLSSAMTAVIALLDAPEADSPLNVDAGEYEAGTKKRYDG
jgi:peroxin-4